MGAEPMATGGTDSGWGSPVTATAHEGRGLAAIAYLFTAVSGLVVLLLARKEQRFARWHAMQAIMLGFAAFVVAAALNLLSAMLLYAGHQNAFNRSEVLSLGMVAWLAAYVLVLIVALAALRGRTVRLPGLAQLADRYA